MRSPSPHHTPGLVDRLGATAVLATAARAAASARPDSLIHDPLAAALVSAPELAHLNETTAALNEQVPALAAAHRQLIDYQAARTHLFDTVLTEACAAGIRQVVILAARFDTRAFRLDLSEDTVVFEIDRPQSLLYKAATLAGRAARPQARWRPVGVEPEANWPRALWNAKFNHNEPTAWLVEGLLPLPDAAQDALVTEIDMFSAAGSKLVLDDSVGPHSGHSDPADWLTSRGWGTETIQATQYLAQLERPVAKTGEELFDLSATFVTAEKIA
ncbi:SAM-dependent methyltransferase [Mycolicibacterium thermoresistibile]